jgi:hypothetical protein
MPYSLEKQLQKKIENGIKKELNKIWKKREENIIDAVNKADVFTMKELEEEAHHMYQKLIDDYYSYKTFWYIRHGQDRPGTCTGENLYKADNIHLKKKGKSFELFLETNYKKMSAGYRDHSRKTVLDMIKDGKRYHVGEWQGYFEGEYIDMFEVNVNEAFEEFKNKFSNMYDVIMEKKLRSLKGTYEYW